MGIQLESPKEIVIGETITISEVFINRITDLPKEGKVLAEVSFDPSLTSQSKTIVLWENKGEDNAYDNIGDWTQEQAENRIVELLK